MISYSFRDCVVQRFRPSSIVFSSDKAKEICMENNLSPAELLRPFADLRREKIAVSTSEKTNHYLANFLLDFYDSPDYERSIASVQLQARHDVLANNPPSEFSSVFLATDGSRVAWKN